MLDIDIKYQHLIRNKNLLIQATYNDQSLLTTMTDQVIFLPINLIKDVEDLLKHP